MVILSDSRQRNAVSEGIALGLLMCSRDQIPNNKIEVDFAFQHAFRTWKHKSQFPRVAADLRNRIDPIWVMTHADERKHVWSLFWQTSGSVLQIMERPGRFEAGFDPEDVAQAVGGEIPSGGWEQLATSFLNHFDESA